MENVRMAGLTLMLWKNRRCVTWDVTVTDTLAQSYLSSTSITSDGAAEAAADRKTSKYLQLAQTYIFVPIAMETLGPINKTGFQFLQRAQCSHCKRCISYGNSLCLSVRPSIHPSVRHMPVLCQNDGT